MNCIRYRKSSIRIGNSLPFAPAIPVVIVPLRPNGLPIAITCSPGLIAEEFARGSGTIPFSCKKSHMI
ncbi:MAG TPA: hypothetical protein VJ729_03115 [Nitrososphaeraceae archaeon]|nr:hypothetical protein [Nitrososphaeraceae archaeon]